MGSIWHPIEDLDADVSAITSPELASLGTLWTEQRDEMSKRGLLSPFTERLQREWAIETGILERLYDLDRGVTRLLIDRGISEELIGHDGADRAPSLVAQILRDHAEVVEGLLDFVGGGRGLSTSYVKELHGALTRSQRTTEAVDQFGRLFEVELLHGEYKMLPNNPTTVDGTAHEYCPPVHVASEMDRLIQMHGEHETAGFSPEVEAAFLHHRFTQIHPFQDGNGRVARALATLVFIKAGWFPPVIRRDDRTAYLDALQAADAGNLGPLVELFVKVQKRSLVQALSISSTVQRADRAADVVAQIAEKFAARRLDQSAAIASLAVSLRDVATQRFAVVASDLRSAIADDSFTFSAGNDRDDDEKAHWYRYQVIETARDLDYFADLSAFHHWARLVLRNADRTEVLLSLHGVGRLNPLAVGGSVCTFRKEPDGTTLGPWTVCEDLFLADPGEPLASTRDRFFLWLERALVVGLEDWRQANGLV